MAPFKVIIVGGSVAGLALAIILEQYGIDYVLLEKHKTIAAQVGASLGTLPHGNKILAQLGVLDNINAIAMPVKYVQGYGPDGKKVGEDTPFGVLMRELYVVSFCTAIKPSKEWGNIESTVKLIDRQMWHPIHIP